MGGATGGVGAGWALAPAASKAVAANKMAWRRMREVPSPKLAALLASVLELGNDSAPPFVEIPGNG